MRVELPNKVKLDDILDAVVGLSVAQAIVDGVAPLQRILESTPPNDAYGLRAWRFGFRAQPHRTPMASLRSVT